MLQRLAQTSGWKLSAWKLSAAPNHVPKGPGGEHGIGARAKLHESCETISSHPLQHQYIMYVPTGGWIIVRVKKHMFAL